jgi:hypothetical protein
VRLACSALDEREMFGALDVHAVSPFPNLRGEESPRLIKIIVVARALAAWKNFGTFEGEDWRPEEP